MTVRRWPQLLPIFVGLIVACAAEYTAPPEGGAGDPRALRGGVTARELAAAVEAPSAAGAVFAALKNSPYSEHKIVIQDLILSPDGSPLLAALAEVRGSTVEEVKAGLLGTRSLDLYIPNAAHRERWTGTEALIVADAREYADGRLPVWGPTGIAATIDPRKGTTPEILLLIQPSEVKAFRVALYSERPAAGVQALGESQEGGLVIRAGVDGLPDTIQLAELARGGRDPGLQLAQACPDDHPEWCEGSGGGSGGGSGQTDPVWQTMGTTYMTAVGAEGVCDNNLCGLGDDNEFEFDARWEYGSVVEHNVIRRTGVPTDGLISGLHVWLLNRKPTLAAPIEIHVIETDVVSDDNFGTAYLGEGDLNQFVYWWENLREVEPYATAIFTW